MTQEKIKKDKPKYNIFQSAIYCIKFTWNVRKSLLFIILAQIFLSVTISLVDVILPKTVVSLIMDKSTMSTLVFTVLSLTTVVVICQLFNEYFLKTYDSGKTEIHYEINRNVLKKYIYTDYAILENEDFNNAKQAALYSSQENAGDGMYDAYTNIGKSILGFIVFASMLAYVNPIILVITSLTGLIGYFTRKWANNWHFMHSDVAQKNYRKICYLNRIGFDYKASKDIRLFSMLNWLTDVFKVSERIALNLNKKLYKHFFFADLADCVGTFIREGISYGYLIWKVINNEIRVDDFVLLFSAINTFSGYIVNILSQFSKLAKLNIRYSKGIEYFEYKNIFKAEDGENINKSENNEYKIELKNVSFKYNGAEDYTLKNINLTIKVGEKLAVVGLNGAGKTTLVKLICGFYDPTEGEVLLNGKNVRDLNRNQYYDLFTAVFQHFNILPLTIAENIAIGDNKIDKEKLYECFKLADIDKKINSLPLKENSLLVKDCYDEAIDLSGGETQRLMLARALYKNSPILILDEPTAALDPIAESRMYEQYNNLAQGKTSIYISHRLASTRFCDRIIFISNNKIAESGTHQELLNLGKEYANLYNIQSKYYKENIEEAM